MNLFTVTIEAEIVCVGETAADAEEAARDAIGDLSSYDFETYAKPMKYLPSGWDEGAIPFGGEGDKTLGEWIAEVGQDYVAHRTKMATDADEYLKRHAAWVKARETDPDAEFPKAEKK